MMFGWMMCSNESCSLWLTRATFLENDLRVFWQRPSPEGAAFVDHMGMMGSNESCSLWLRCATFLGNDLWVFWQWLLPEGAAFVDLMGMDDGFK
jgi:hypothetical protein